MDDIARSIGADSLGFISLQGLVEAVGVPAEQLCRACVDGHYPIKVPATAASILGIDQPAGIPGIDKHVEEDS